MFVTTFARRAFRDARPVRRCLFSAILLITCLAPAGCAPSGEGEGPGHRAQRLALSPEQELALGQQAYHEVMAKARVLPGGAEVDRVRTVGQRIARAVEIEPLQREINLHIQGYHFEWEFNVFEDDHINAFCLPAGKVAVFTGLLNKLRPSDDQLATVMSHEIAHALAHHASERLARAQRSEFFTHALGGVLGDDTIGVLAAGAARVRGLAYDRQQESEADHIGMFLMTFADYNPREAITFWERMQQATANSGRPPEILSDHPSDAKRIAQMKAWVPQAEAGLHAFREGQVAGPPPDRGRGGKRR